MNVSDVEDQYKTRLENVAINECCCLVYTSGTVGMPKGVMLSHDNITFDVRGIVKAMDRVVVGAESIVSYLPLSHVAAQTVDIYTCAFVAGCIWSSGSLKKMLASWAKGITLKHYMVSQG